MKKYNKIIATTLIAIILGAVGSGVWEYILEPLLASSSKAILNIATLGIDSFKNDLYSEVAKGLHEKASYSLLSKFNLLLILAMFIFSLATLKKVKKLIARRSEMMKKIHKLENNEIPDKKSLSEMKEDLQEINVGPLLKTSYFLLGMTALLFSAQYIASKRDLYVNDAIAHYQQSKNIIAPYISNVELLVFNSRFSQIEKPQNYYKIMDDLNGIAKNNKIQLPKFDAW